MSLRVLFMFCFTTLRDWSRKTDWEQKEWCDSMGHSGISRDKSVNDFIQIHDACSTAMLDQFDLTGSVSRKPKFLHMSCKCSIFCEYVVVSQMLLICDELHTPENNKTCQTWNNWLDSFHCVMTYYGTHYASHWRHVYNICLLYMSI